MEQISAKKRNIFRAWCIQISKGKLFYILGEQYMRIIGEKGQKTARRKVVMMGICV